MNSAKHVESWPHLLGCRARGCPETFQAEDAWTPNTSPTPQLQAELLQVRYASQRTWRAN